MPKACQKQSVNIPSFSQRVEELVIADMVRVGHESFSLIRGIYFNNPDFYYLVLLSEKYYTHTPCYRLWQRLWKISAREEGDRVFLTRHTVSSNNHQNTAHVPTAHSQVILPVSLTLPVQSAAERKCLRQESKILWSCC